MSFDVKKLFTLIELLIVISIISIMASLLLPALRNSMNAAKVISCKNQLKQLAISAYNYAEDFEGYAPCGSFVHNYMFTYQYQNKFPDYIPGPRVKDSVGYILPAMSICLSGAKINYAPYFSYGFNYRFSISPLTDSDVPLKIILAKMPGSTFLIADTNYAGGRLKWNYTLEPRHTGGVNILFVDGHVEWWKYEKIPAVYTIDTINFFGFK